MRNTDRFNHVSYIFFRIFPLYDCKHLPATVKMLGTFMEIILRKPFQLFRHIPYYVISVIKAPSL